LAKNQTNFYFLWLNSYEKLTKLLAGLDEKSVKTVITILTRLVKIMPIIKGMYNLKNFVTNSARN
jgi:hypothetical protein